LEYPLTGGYRAFYWVILVIMLISLTALLANGRIGIPGFVAIAGAYALFHDWQLKKKLEGTPGNA